MKTITQNTKILSAAAAACAFHNNPSADAAPLMTDVWECAVEETRARIGRADAPTPITDQWRAVIDTWDDFSDPELGDVEALDGAFSEMASAIAGFDYDRRAFVFDPITSLGDAAVFLGCLWAFRLEFHLDDDPREIFIGDRRLFSEDEAEAIKLRVSELSEIDFREISAESAFDILIALTNSDNRDGFNL